MSTLKLQHKTFGYNFSHHQVYIMKISKIYRTIPEFFASFCISIAIHLNSRFWHYVFLIQICNAQNSRLTAFEFFLVLIIICCHLYVDFAKKIVKNFNPKPITGVHFTQIDEGEDHIMASCKREVYGRSRTVSNQPCFLLIVLHRCLFTCQFFNLYFCTIYHLIFNFSRPFFCHVMLLFLISFSL